MLFLPSIYQSDDLQARSGASANAAECRPLPDASGHHVENGRVLISRPAPANTTPTMTDTPQPRWQHSSAWRISFTLPTHSKL